MELNEINDRITHVKTLVADCSDHLDSLESLLDSAELICGQAVLDEYGERIAAAVR